jgi:hypothetical protein
MGLWNRHPGSDHWGLASSGGGHPQPNQAPDCVKTFR